MTLPALATADDLAGYLGVTFSDDEEERAEVVLRHASSAVRVEAGENWVDAEGEALEDVPLGIAEITVQVAARHWVNPTGLRAEGTGPISSTYIDVMLTDAERAAISRAMRKPTSGLFTISTTRDNFETGTVYLDVVPAGEPIPFLDNRDVV